MRNSAVAALNNFGALVPGAGASAVPWLLRASKDADVSVRQQATWALHKNAPREAWPQLATGLADPAMSVRVASAMALAHLGAPVPADDFVALLEACAGSWLERQVAYALDLLVVHRPEMRAVVA